MPLGFDPLSTPFDITRSIYHCLASNERSVLSAENSNKVTRCYLNASLTPFIFKTYQKLVLPNKRYHSQEEKFSLDKLQVPLILFAKKILLAKKKSDTWEVYVPWFFFLHSFFMIFPPCSIFYKYVGGEYEKREKKQLLGKRRS